MSSHWRHPWRGGLGGGEGGSGGEVGLLPRCVEGPTGISNQQPRRPHRRSPRPPHTSGGASQMRTRRVMRRDAAGRGGLKTKRGLGQEAGHRPPFQE